MSQHQLKIIIQIKYTRV